jgi:ABC-type xylose transport system permease subunit
MFQPLLAILRRNIQLSVGSYCTYNGSVVLCALCIIKLQYITYLANPAIVSLNVRVGVV